MTHPLIALFGGSFDPVHNGHIALAESLHERFGFQELRFLPAARSPLKGEATPDQHRLSMIELAIRSKQAFTIDDRELKRPPPSYTIDTLKALRQELGNDTALVFILGQDSFADLPRWKDWQHLTDYAHLLVVNRPGAVSKLPEPLQNWLTPRLKTFHKTLHKPSNEQSDTLSHEPLNQTIHGGVWMVETPPHNIASQQIRATIQAGESTKDWLNPAVSDYIAHHHLYRGDTPSQ